MNIWKARHPEEWKLRQGGVLPATEKSVNKARRATVNMTMKLASTAGLGVEGMLHDAESAMVDAVSSLSPGSWKSTRCLSPGSETEKTSMPSNETGSQQIRSKTHLPRLSVRRKNDVQIARRASFSRKPKSFAL